MPRLDRYQVRGVDHLWRHPRAALFYEMGTGKTATVLAALTAAHLPALVIAPKRVAELTWPVEAAKFRPDLSVALAAGTPAQRAAALAASADVTIIGRDNSADAAARGRVRWRTVVIDELSGYRDRSTRRHRYARYLAARATYVWGLTGTPMPISPGDLWGQLLLLDGGERLGRSVTRFREQYQVMGARLPSGIVTRWDMQPGATERIIARISDICQAVRTADVLDLPDLLTEREPVEMPADTREAYRSMARDLVISLAEPDGSILAANTAVAVGKLGQLAAGFVYDEDGAARWYDTAKLAALDETMERTGRQAALVFYGYRAEREALRERYPDALDVRDAGAVAAWNAGQCPVLIAHPASAGHGLNLQSGGHHVYWLTLPWSPELYAQANARLHRRGQGHPVIVHRIETVDSVDGIKSGRLAGRQTAQDDVLAHLTGQSATR